MINEWPAWIRQAPTPAACADEVHYLVEAHGAMRRGVGLWSTTTHELLETHKNYRRMEEARVDVTIVYYAKERNCIEVPTDSNMIRDFLSKNPNSPSLHEMLNRAGSPIKSVVHMDAEGRNDEQSVLRIGEGARTD